MPPRVRLRLRIDLYLAVGVDVPDDPRKITVTAAHPSVAQKHDLREPSLVREGGPLAVDE